MKAQRAAQLGLPSLRSGGGRGGGRGGGSGGGRGRGGPSPAPPRPLSRWLPGRLLLRVGCGLLAPCLPRGPERSRPPHPPPADPAHPQSGTYGDIYNFPQRQYEAALQQEEVVDEEAERAAEEAAEAEMEVEEYVEGDEEEEEEEEEEEVGYYATNTVLHRAAC